jgi:mitogen-activated protein kinase 1/3
MVCSATDAKKDNQKVAIKKIRDVFHNLTDAKRILREIKLLQHFDHPNIIKLTDMLNPLSKEDFEDLYLVMEYMQSDLYRIVYSDNELSEDHIAYVIYQILCGLKYMHSAKVLHRDLKPGNILINADCNVKICDLGLARGLDAIEDESAELTEYVVTRWYRAPEVMVSAQSYGYGVDAWAVGCIMGELFNREPLFQGDNYVDQLNVIFSVIGTPTEEDLESIFNVEALQFIKKLKKKTAVPFKKVFPTASAKALDLLEKLLVFSPKNRITIDDALRHPFFKRFYNDEFVSSCVCKSGVFASEFEKMTRTKESIQDQMFQEILKFRPHAVQQNPLTLQRRGSSKARHRISQQAL